MFEIKDAKSWGNGSFRFSVMDIIKIVSFVGSVMYFGMQVSSKIEVLTAEFKAASVLHQTVHESINARLNRLENEQDKRSGGWQFNTKNGGTK